jgi:histidine triad (HIT) family protein
MESCPFCRIREGALSAHVLYEDDEVLAFLDIYPVTQGHTLVVPRRHAASLAECPPATVAALFLAAVRLAGAIQRGLGAPGFNLGVNDGRAAGQEVPHAGGEHIGPLLLQERRLAPFPPPLLVAPPRLLALLDHRDDPALPDPHFQPVHGRPLG